MSFILRECATSINSHTDAFGQALQCSDWHSVAAMLSDTAQLEFLPIKVIIHIVQHVQKLKLTLS
jgi:hypothetical protein